jgi:uncharacterized membrane protein
MDFVKKYKLRILSVLSVLFLFLPFVKQCEMNDNAPEESEYAGRFVEENKIEIISNCLSDLGFYFTEESESVIDLAFQIKGVFETSMLNDLGLFLMLFSSIFSILLVLFSLFGLYKIFKNKLRNILKVYLTSLILVVLILAINAYFFVERIGQIKIGFYLLLITNFYLFNHFRKLKIEE